MNMLEEWLNPIYLSKQKRSSLKELFEKSKPYNHLALKDFLKKEKADLLLKSLSNEKFEAKESDLFKLKQTVDFLSIKNPELKSFRDLLASAEFIEMMQEITGENLKVGSVDCAGSLYEPGDFLLPHDDRLDGRKVAYIFYLSTLQKKKGGALELYSSNEKTPVRVAKSMQPSFNTWCFFKVSEISFHQVSEVVSDVQRISINGWLHGK